MAKEIDFLKSKRKEYYRIQKIIHLLNVGSLVVLIFYCSTVAATIFLLQRLKNESQSLTNQTNIKKAQIEQYKEVISFQYVLKQRLAYMVNVFSKKKISTAEVFSFFQRSLETGILIKKLDITDKNEIIFSGQANNVVILSDFLNIFKTEEAKILFSKTMISSLSRQKDGSYLLNLNFVLNEKS